MTSRTGQFRKLLNSAFWYGGGMKAIEVIGRDEDQLRRIANRQGLHFHIDQFGYLTEHAGWKSETRPATEAELQMWRVLVPGLPEWLPGGGLHEVPVWDALPSELEDVLWEGPYTLSAEDVAVLRRVEGFVPCNDRASLQRGLIGHLRSAHREADIYVSRAIPKGYFHEGAMEPFRPPEGERVVDPGLALEVEMELSVSLRGFGV